MVLLGATTPAGNVPLGGTKQITPIPVAIHPQVAPIPDLMGDLMGLDNSDIFHVDKPSTTSGPPLPVVLPAAAALGLQISAHLILRDGHIFYNVLFENNTQMPLDGFLI
ncbi:Beta-adaptin-like protein B [Linum perenne]